MSILSIIEALQMYMQLDDQSFRHGIGMIHQFDNAQIARYAAQSHSYTCPACKADHAKLKLTRTK